MKHLICLALLTIYLLNMQAQSDYRPGYIIKKNGETVNGWINFLGDASNGIHCFFKTDSTSKDIVKYTPADLTAYRFKDSKYYISKKINTPEGQKEFFFECLISGKATIYYSYRNDNEYFYIEKDGKMLDMKDKEIYTESRYGTQTSRQSNQYKGVLKYSFQDCPPVFRKIDQANLDKKTLVKLSKDYHEYVCKDEQCIIYEKKFTKNRLQFGADFSYGIGNLNFGYGRIDFIKSMTDQFLVEAFIQTNLDENKHYVLQFSLGYNSLKLHLNNYIAGPNINFNRPVNINYESAKIRTTFALKYKFKYGKTEPFCSLGLPIAFYLTDKGDITYLAEMKNYYFDRAGYHSENVREHLIFGGIAEIGLEHPVLHSNAFLSVFYEHIQTMFQLRNNRLGLKTGFYL